MQRCGLSMVSFDVDASTPRIMWSSEEVERSREAPETPIKSHACDRTPAMGRTMSTRSAVSDWTDVVSTVCGSDGWPVSRQISLSPSWDSETDSSGRSPQDGHKLVESLIENVRLLSCEAEGSRKVQRAIICGPPDVKEIIARELVGHIPKIARDPHGNHVLQRLIDESSPEKCQFIVDELSSAASLMLQASRHRYGCRVLQHLMKRVRLEQMSSLSSVLVENGASLSCHPFGTYVMRCFIGLCSRAHRYQLVRQLEREIARICETPSGCAVIVAAFVHCESEDTVWLARAVVSSGRLAVLARVRHGSDAAILVVKALPMTEGVVAQAMLESEAISIRETRHGRLALEGLQAVKDEFVSIRGTRSGRIAYDRIRGMTEMRQNASRRNIWPQQKT